jgi:hypothetical protein
MASRMVGVSPITTIMIIISFSIKDLKMDDAKVASSNGIKVVRFKFIAFLLGL